MDDFFLAIDQGTTSSRAIIFDSNGQQKAVRQEEYAQHYPHDGWVEHEAEDIWETTLNCCREVIPQSGAQARDVRAIGISNQRETTIVWNKTTGKAISRAIVWQDRRTADYCAELSKDAAIEKMVETKTGLRIDPYFSATKLRWILQNVEQAKQYANENQLLFGTVDTYLIWRLTNGVVHATDATNACRTLLFNIHTQQWDDELLNLFGIPKSMLPEVRDSNGDFGQTSIDVLGAEVPIRGVAGDQQAATVGQACFQPGMMKSTYGTGCFLVLNTGDQAVVSQNRLLTTVAYRISGNVTYALEGSIFNAGTGIQWLRDQLHFFENSAETEAIATRVSNTGNVYMVPAFTGLGAPYWDPHARGAILGLTRDTQIAHIVRATLESVAYQTRDLMLAMQADYGSALETLRVDGGMVRNDWLIQFLADILDLPVERPACIETSALGAASLAALGVGYFSSLGETAKNWAQDQHCEPAMDAGQRDALYQGWLQAVHRVLD